MTLGERIKERRKELGISVDDIAAKLGKNRATVYRYESNSIENMPVSVVEPLAEILKTTPAQLLGLPDDEGTALILAFRKEDESGRTHAKDEMFRLYGKDHCAHASRVMEDHYVALLYYKAYQDNYSCAMTSSLLSLLEEATDEDLEAIYGMVSGFLKRKQRKKKNAVPGAITPETTDTEDTL
ncbi:MAG: helix-turn-helix transcriptional regulator [Oscillibacter sp.]|nr:helix-turn-helix transcriptional regulator [Oscillibacter sp.]